MQQDHYKTLGVTRSASSNDIKSAYRKIVLKHHPDKSSSADSAQIFLKATEAYEILSDFDRRKQYDSALENERRRIADEQRIQTQKKAAATQTQSKVQPVNTIAADVTKLSLIFTRGQYAESEKLARTILIRDSRQPIPYAVLGDLARAKGNMDEAAKMYAFAAQMDPRNPIYQQRHEELIRTVQVSKTQAVRGQSVQEGKSVMSLVVGFLLLVCCCFYVIVAKEEPILPKLSLVGTWTLGLFVMLFMAGVSAGSVLSTSNLIDRFHINTNSLGKVSSPMIALTSIAIVNFWAAAILFAGIATKARGANVNHIRFLGSIAGTVVLIAVSCTISRSSINPTQVLLWGGNLVYIGGVCGWMVADSFKRMTPY